MPSNIIIFEAEYVSELVSSMSSACELMSEAVQSLKQASLHEGWKCKECTRIASELDDLNLRLGRLDGGVNDTARVLGGSVNRFTSLEASYKSQVKEISDNLTQNHGFAGEVHTDPSGSQNNSGEQGGQNGQNGQVGQSGQSGRGANGGNGSPGGHSGAGGNRTGSNPGSNNAGSASGGKASGAGAAVGAGARAAAGAAARAASSSGGAGVIISDKENTSSASSSLAGAGGASLYSSMSINLPVTHIPDRPEAAAKGIKYTQEIADIAVSKVADTITEALVSNPVRLQTSAGAGMAAQNLVEAYNAGKRIVESSASIMSNPSMPHTNERLTMAEGIVNLAGTSTFTMAGSNSSVVINQGMTENLRSNAGNLLSAMNSSTEEGELKNVLTSFMSETSEEISPFTVSGNSGGGKNFFDMIIEAIKKNLSGGSEASSSASGSPVDDFLKNLITEQV